MKVFRVGNKFFTSGSEYISQSAEYVGKFEFSSHPDANPDGSWKFYWGQFAKRDKCAQRWTYSKFCSLNNAHYDKVEQN